MKLVIDLADRIAILNTYGDCERWRQKGKVLRGATVPGYEPLDPSTLIPNGEWQSLLELGCGLEGWIKGVVGKASRAATVYACDLNESVLRNFSKEFIENCSGRKIKHHCVLADGEKLPFADKSFDAISAVFVGHHMVDADRFVGGLARILKPKGWLLTNSLVWSYPPPDFPSQALQNLLGKPASFFVRNAFDEAKARQSLLKFFAEVREARDIKSATLSDVNALVKFHSRQEHFIERTLLPEGYRWSDYLARVSQIATEYIASNGSYHFELPIVYFLATGPRVQ